MEKVISKIMICCGCLILGQISSGCRSHGYVSRESQVPENEQLPAIELVPDDLNPRWHPGLEVLNQTIRGS